MRKICNATDQNSTLLHDRHLQCLEADPTSSHSMKPLLPTRFLTGSTDRSCINKMIASNRQEGKDKTTESTHISRTKTKYQQNILVQYADSLCITKRLFYVIALLLHSAKYVFAMFLLPDHLILKNAYISTSPNCPNDNKKSYVPMFLTLLP